MLSSGGSLQIVMPMLSVHKLLTFLWADFTELMQTCWQIMVSQLVPVEHGFSHVRLVTTNSIGNFENKDCFKLQKASKFQISVKNQKKAI